VALTHLHLSPELVCLQRELMQRIHYTRDLAARMGVRFISQGATPIFFLSHDSPQAARAAARAFWSEGIYVCPVNFPAVPVNTPGIRFSVTLHNELPDIDRFMETALHLQSVWAPWIISAFSS
jgi:7-keto-8-aminopelargonate synthetase-like enzyme